MKLHVQRDEWQNQTRHLTAGMNRLICLLLLAATRDRRSFSDMYAVIPTRFNPSRPAVNAPSRVTQAISSTCSSPHALP